MWFIGEGRQVKKELSLSNEGVFKQHKDRWYPFNEKVGLISQLVAKIQKEVAEGADTRQELFGEGIECQILEPGFEQWQTGKLRIRIEFCPDSPPEQAQPLAADPSDSPLDALRQPESAAENQ